MENYTKKLDTYEGRLIKFVEPPEVRGVTYLTRSYREWTRDDDIWVYLPAECLIRRISGGGKKGMFMRSDLAYEDIQEREVDEDDHQLLGMERFCGFDCYVVRMKAKKQKDTNYSQRLVWVRKDIWLPVKVDYYDQRGKYLKTALCEEFKQINGIWTTTKIVVETPQKASRTTLSYTDVQYNVGLSESIFEQENLKR
jgi:hypothetical protein